MQGCLSCKHQAQIEREEACENSKTHHKVQNELQLSVSKRGEGTRWTERAGATAGPGRNKEGAEGKRQGREFPECKAVFGWNAQPPVRSCKLTGNRPKSCPTQMERAGEMRRGGGGEMDVLRERER